jgi:PKD domain
VRLALVLASLAVLSCSAEATAATPLLEGEWKFSERVVKDTTGQSIKLPPGQRYKSLVGTRNTQKFDFSRCAGCPGVFKFSIGPAPDAKLVKLRRRGSLLVVNYGCRHPCTRSKKHGPKTGCRHWVILRLRVGRSFDFEGLRLAQTASGTLEYRTDPCRGRLRRLVYSFKAKRTQRPFADDAIVSASTTTPCDPLALSFATDKSGPSYLWDFGDGTTSTEAKPTHRYAAHGQYKVKVRIRLADGWVAVGSLDADLSDPAACG